MQNIINQHQLKGNDPVPKNKGRLITVGPNLPELEEAITDLSIP